jgi:hypothetical protein
MVKAFGWITPGDVRVFKLDELEVAKNWVGN